MLVSSLAGSSLTREINRHSHLPSGPFRTSMRPVGDDTQLMSSVFVMRHRRACVREALCERTDKAQVEHLGGKENNTGNVSAGASRPVTINSFRKINALGSDAPEEGGNGA